MARGRLISRTLGSSRKFADLHRHAGKLREFCQALYPLMVSNTDDFGRMAGDAFTVKHAVFPTSPRDEEEFQAALVAMHNARLIQIYTDESKQLCIQVCQFDTHQPGLSKRTKSRFSEPPVNFTEIPGISREPREIPKQLKRIEGNRTEGKRTEGNRTEPIRSHSATDELSEDSETEPETPNAKIGTFIKAFCELYRKHRHGARYHVVRHRDIPLVKRLLGTYPEARLTLMAQALFKADDEWIDDTDRGISILSVKATWLDARLAAYESKHGTIQQRVRES